MSARVLSARQLVAVTEHVEHAGLIVWWRLSGVVHEGDLRRAWTARNLVDALLPVASGPSVALARAVGEHRSQHVLTRPIKGGHALVHEHQSADDLEYSTGLRVRLDVVGRPVFDPSGHALASSIRAAYERNLEYLTSADVGSWLCQIVAHVDGVRLRDTGGVYFVPATRVSEWERIKDALHAVSDNRINGVPALRGEDAVASILDAVATEAAAVAAELEAELASGLTAKKASSRADRCVMAEAKVARYEALLGAKAAGLGSRLEDLRAQLAVAALAGEDHGLAGL